MDTAAGSWKRGAEINAFARALHVVFKSSSWDYVAVLAAEAWATGSDVPWHEVEKEVQVAWAAAAAGIP